MPENPSQTTPHPDLKQEEARPSDAELANAPEEGRAARDPHQEDAEARS